MPVMIKKIPLELLIWLGAFIWLYNLQIDKESISICPIHGLGFSWCPGCGLARSVSLLMHGHVHASFELHWLGFPVFAVLIYRIIQLTKNYLTLIKPKNDTI
jgi:hypothetical protein